MTETHYIIGFSARRTDPSSRDRAEQFFGHETAEGSSFLQKLKMYQLVFESMFWLLICRDQEFEYHPSGCPLAVVEVRVRITYPVIVS
jgi:hypothetical protein